MQLTPPPVAKAPRRKPGRGSQVMPDERREIQRLHLAEGLNQRQLADRFGRTRETIAGVLKDPEFQAVKREVYAEMAEEARSGEPRGHDNRRRAPTAACAHGGADTRHAD